MQQTLGQGSFGWVTLVRETNTNKLFAMKAVTKCTFVDEEGGVVQVLLSRKSKARNKNPKKIRSSTYN